MACPNFLPAKKLCAALLTKFEKEDLAKVVSNNSNSSGPNFDCEFSSRSGYGSCPHYREQQSKLK